MESDRRPSAPVEDRRAASGESTSAAARVRRILVGTDFSKGADRALAVAVEVARACRAPIDLVHVYPPVMYTSAPPVPGAFPAAPSPVALDNIEVTLAELADGVRAAGVECSTTSIEGDPAREITSRARGVGDLIVLGTQGRTGLSRLLLGSVAEETLRRAACPVLVVPDEAAKSEETH